VTSIHFSPLKFIEKGNRFCPFDAVEMYKESIPEILNSQAIYWAALRIRRRRLIEG